MIAATRKRESEREREHRYDREVIAAVWHRQKAQREPYKFLLPPSLRRQT